MQEQPQQIRVAIVDDHSGVREGIKNLLKPVKDMIVIGEAVNGVDALILINEKHPDILLLDVELPIMRGDQVARRIREKYKDIKVLAISSYNEYQYIQSMLTNGAAGYITKDEAPTMLVDAIRSIYQKSESWISPQAQRQNHTFTPDRKTFTQREIKILQAIASEKSEHEISIELGIDKKILDRYIRLLMLKFDIENRKNLSRVARQNFLNQN